MKTTQAMELMEELVKAKIPKQTAKHLIDLIESQNGELATKHDIQLVKKDVQAVEKDVQAVEKEVQSIKWIIGITLPFLGAVMLGGFLWLRSDIQNNRQEFKQEMGEFRQEMGELKKDMGELEAKLDLLLQTVNGKP